MWGSLNVPFGGGFEVMEKELEIDPDFQLFHKLCIRHEIPFNVTSAGLKPILRKVLDTFSGEEVRPSRLGSTKVKTFDTLTSI
jgi:2-hydroxy-3-keto-5-methylthiopentenyl-1-phosphate phosphatase